MPPWKNSLSCKAKNQNLMRILLICSLLLLSKGSHAQIEFSFFKGEIDRLKKDRKVIKYWRELYHYDRDNTSLDVPMDSVTVLNRLKAAYLIEQYGFPDPDRFGTKAANAFLSIHAHNHFSDISALTFQQLLEGKKLSSWQIIYPNYPLMNLLFWYNGKEIVLDQEFELALKTLENRPKEELDMEQLCAMASSFLYMQRARDTKVLGEWMMSFPAVMVPLQLLKYDSRYYLKKGKYYFLLKKETENSFRFYTALDKTTLSIFENGELVLRDMYEREMVVYPVKN
jgi:hypothetical protein